MVVSSGRWWLSVHAVVMMVVAFSGGRLRLSVVDDVGCHWSLSDPVSHVFIFFYYACSTK